MKELREVEERLKKLSKKKTPGQWKAESYIGKESSRFLFLDLKVPHIRNAQKEGYSFSEIPFKDELMIWTAIWNQTKYFEVALSATHFLNKVPAEVLNSHHKIIMTWQKKVDNWAHSDEMSNCYSRLLEFNKKEIMPYFEKWNKAKNPWDIRQSLVGLLFYSRFRKKVLPCKKILSFLTPHFSHSHYYVQKAIGWTLRECYNLYSKETLNYMKKYAKLIPPPGWTAATEKLSKRDKDALILLRKGG